MITIIDYGAGNIANVKNAFNKIGVDAVASSDPMFWEKADGLVLPGVGSFGAAMKKIEPNANVICDLIKQKPFLGICLGMQLLFEKSEESPKTKGLGVLKGAVKKFNFSLPVPHIGWNLVSSKDSIFGGNSEFYAYFVHSYYCVPDGQVVSAWTNYGLDFPSVICSKNILLTQFHPEKSGNAGLDLLKRFTKEVKK
ncbi:MAG: imidazole glycerol phosphate synthase subunit HisH [Candidatus Micrarchaeota archaeon]